MSSKGGYFISEYDCGEIRRRRQRNVPAGVLADEYDTTGVTVRKHATGQCSHEIGVEPVELENQVSDPEKILRVLEESGERFLTTSEVGEHPDVYGENATIRRKLKDLADRDLVEYRQVKRAYCWWIPEERS